MGHKVVIWGSVGLLVVGITAFEFWMRSEQKVVVPTEPALPMVRLIEIQSGDATESKSFPGFVKENTTAKLAFRVPGPLDELEVTIGKEVEAGTILAMLDPRDFELAVQRAQAGLAEAEAGLKAMKTGARVEDIAALEAKVRAADSQLDTAKLQWERMDRLFREGTAPKVQYDVAKTQYDQALAQSEASHKELEKAKTGARPEEIEAMEAKIAGIKVQLATAQNALSDSVLKAPFNGFVSQKYVENHEMVAAGSPILSFTDTSVLEVSSSVPEEVVLRQNDFQKFYCEFEAYPRRRFDAEFKEIGQSLQQGKQAYPLIVRIPTMDHVSLRPGMSANLIVELARPDTPLIVPAGAVVANDDASNGGMPNEGSIEKVSAAGFVCVVEDDTIHCHPVKILRILERGVELECDLPAGSRIVGAGARYLSEGQKVRIES